MIKRVFLVFGIAALLFSCNEPEEQKIVIKEVPSGMWLGQIALSDSINLPFTFDWNGGDKPVMILNNAEEQIRITEIEMNENNVHLNFPVFNTSLEFSFTKDSMTGQFIKNDAKDYSLAFNAKKVETKQRYSVTEEPCCSIEKQWAVTFRPGAENSSMAIGEFTQEGSIVRGTFMTEYGDYRFLSGVLNDNKLELAGFDGSTLYVFKANVKDGEMDGTFFSGKSRADHWTAKRDSTFKLRDPESMTYLKEGYTSIEFTLPLTPDTSLVFNQENYNGTVTILQILGTWCPNCMDESRYLEKLYEYYQKDGLNVIGLAFERKNNQAIGFKAIEKMGTDLELRYPIGFAGSTSKEDRANFLPQLNAISSFPTTIFIDKKGVVRKIHTGFNGPSTSAYAEYEQETYEFVQSLLLEE